MATEAYQRFTTWIESTGRRYFDGLSERELVGLSDSERADVRAQLMNRAEKGDAVSLSCLRNLLTADDFSALAEPLVQRRWDDELFAAHLHTMLCDASPSARTWDDLIDFLEQSGVPGRRWIVDDLSTKDVPQPHAHRLAVTVAALLRRENDQQLLLSESVVLLKALGFSPGSMDFMQHAKQLASHDKRNRDTLLSTLGVG